MDGMFHDKPALKSKTVIYFM